MFVRDGKFDFQQLGEVTEVVARNLNRILDVNVYPDPRAKRSSDRHRPIGIGVQGLVDAFVLRRLPFDSEEARILNRQIFEVIYFHALRASCDIARYDGHYETYPGSPMSKGLFQFNLWGKTWQEASAFPPDQHLDWEGLKADIARYGIRNSLLTAPMPTASTSQILGNTEAFEAFNSNLYVRRTLAGEFVCVNKHLVKDLMELNLWNEQLKDQIVAGNGSIQHINSIPDDIKLLYRTVWEISQKAIIDMAADRGVYIDQSQSLNIHMTNVDAAKLTSMHFYGWRKGLKTGMYYLRTKSATDAVKVTLDPTCSLVDKDGCLSCSS